MARMDVLGKDRKKHKWSGLFFSFLCRFPPFLGCVLDAKLTGFSYVSAGPWICPLTSAIACRNAATHANKAAFPSKAGCHMKYPPNTHRDPSSLDCWKRDDCRCCHTEPQNHLMHICLLSLNNEEALLPRSHCEILSCRQHGRSDLLRSWTERASAQYLKGKMHATLMTCGVKQLPSSTRGKLQ